MIKIQEKKKRWNENLVVTINESQLVKWKKTNNFLKNDRETRNDEKKKKKERKKKAYKSDVLKKVKYSVKILVIKFETKIKNTLIIQTNFFFLSFKYIELLSVLANMEVCMSRTFVFLCEKV